MKENNISQLGDYDAPFCEKQHTHGLVISLCSNHLISLIPPKQPQILDIRHLEQEEAVYGTRRSTGRFPFK